jgi:hypothetical protein
MVDGNGTTAQWDSMANTTKPMALLKIKLLPIISEGSGLQGVPAGDLA